MSLSTGSQNSKRWAAITSFVLVGASVALLALGLNAWDRYAVSCLGKWDFFIPSFLGAGILALLGAGFALGAIVQRWLRPLAVVTLITCLGLGGFSLLCAIFSDPSYGSCGDY